jgi:hypothetical protein
VSLLRYRSDNYPRLLPSYCRSCLTRAVDVVGWTFVVTNSAGGRHVLLCHDCADELKEAEPPNVQPADADGVLHDHEGNTP